MPYTNQVGISSLNDEIKKFKAITDEAAISPVVLGNLLSQFASRINEAAKAFGIPPNIPYADTFGCVTETDRLKLHYHYRCPDGHDEFHPVYLPAATEKSAGVMSANDMKVLSLAGSLCQRMEVGGDQTFQWAESLRDWFNEASDRPLELIYQINARPTEGNVGIEVATLDIMNPANGEYDREVQTTIAAATTETAGVMTALDKGRLDHLFEQVGSCNLPIDTLTEPGYYRLVDGTLVAVTESAKEKVNNTTSRWTVMQTRFTANGLETRTVGLQRTGRDLSKGEWSEWEPVKFSLSVGEGLDLSSDNMLTLNYRAKQMLFDDLWTKAVGSYGKVDHTHVTADAGGRALRTPYYLNELWLSYDEALAVYEAGAMDDTSQDNYYTDAHIRTNLPPKFGRYANIYIGNLGMRSDIEVLNMNSRYRINYNDDCWLRPGYVNNGRTFLNGCPKLKRVLGGFDIRDIKSKYLIHNCPLLEDIEFVSLRYDFNLEECPKLSFKTISTIINRCIMSESVRTVTVHKDVYAKLTADETNEAYAALPIQEKVQWGELIELAEAKNITFASA